MDGEDSVADTSSVSPARPPYRWPLLAWCAGLAALVLAPLARPGFLLSYDMVTVPQQELVPDALGLGSALPRAVPLDAVVALLTQVVPGELVYRAALVGILSGGAIGAAMLLPRASGTVRAVAASAYVWNAYVAERLVIGHWGLLVGYAVLPWLLRAGLAVRHGDRAALPKALVLVALASVTPTGGVLATGVLVVVVALPGRRQRWPVALAAAGSVVLQLPWLVPGVLTPTSSMSDPRAVEAFAAHPDSPLGLVGSVLTLGGIWNSEVVPDSRSLWTAAIITIAWVGLALGGVTRLRATMGSTATLALAVLAVLGIVLSLSGAFGGALAWAVERFPGVGLLRDGTKFLAWYSLALAPAAALGAARLAASMSRWSGGLVSATVVASTAALMPLAALPDLAWGVGGRLSPVQYPPSWNDVRDALQRDPARGALVVLPYQPYRSFDWNDGRTVLDPLPRYVGVETVVPDTLTVGSRRLAGEDPRAAAVAEALDAPEPAERLLRLGVGWVAVEHGTPGAPPPGVLEDLDPVIIGGDLDLYRVRGDPAPWQAVPPRAPVLVAHLTALAIAVGSAAWVATAKLTRNGQDTLVQSAQPDRARQEE
jgi:hypothetical protein